MKIKKYKARTFAEAFEKMKKELGGEAIILNSRRVTDPAALDFVENQEPYYEVTAAVDSGGRIPVYTPGTTLPRPAPKPAPAPSRKEIHSRPVVRQPAARPAAHEPAEAPPATSDIKLIKHEMRDMKRVLHEVSDFLRHQRMPAVPAIFRNAMKGLVGREVNEELARSIVQTVYARMEPRDYTDSAIIEGEIRKLLVKIIRTAPPLEASRKRPKIAALVGPTGVGKTTTVAKLASGMKLFQHKSVALISADTYRIAAIEQLQTFANIAAIPLSVVYSPAEMRDAIVRFRDHDLILIDTVGRSQKNRKQIADLQTFVEAAEPDETHLVLSLTSSLRSLRDVLERFAVLQPNRLIFTKLDETDTPGAMLNLLYKHRLPVSYVTTGQVVPNDILPADSTQLASLILEGEVLHA